MRPIKFKESQVILGKRQQEYNNLPAFRPESPNGDMITCWSLSFKERVILLLTGKLWLNQLTFGSNFRPVMMSVHRLDMFIRPEDSRSKIEASRRRQEKEQIKLERENQE